MSSIQLSITCPVCRMTSYNETDWREGYCGNCHAYTSIPKVRVGVSEVVDNRFRVYQLSDGSRWREMSVIEAVDYEFYARRGWSR